MKFFLILFFLPTIVFAQNLRVVDGDTIHIGKIKYRFHGIDAPEMSQICKQNNKSIKCGVLSKVKLVEKISNQKVNCKKITTDRYKRIVAECFVNNESLSSFLVKNGYAFAYRRYSKQFVEDENFARKNKLGIWAMKFIYPWNYRNKSK